MAQQVILVDEKDNAIGTGEKITVHKNGQLHRAFSVFIFNSKGELLLQQRALSKYHSPGLWSNTCCGHPKPDEPIDSAARRGLKEEMGIEADLKELFSFIYKVPFPNGLSENEYLHVFAGRFDGSPQPSPQEAANWKWVDTAWLKKDIKENPDNYTYWFRLDFEKAIALAL